MSSAPASIRLSRATKAVVSMAAMAAMLLLAGSASQQMPRDIGFRAAAPALSAASGHLSPDRKCAPVCAAALL